MKILVTTNGSRVVWKSSSRQYRLLVQLLNNLLPKDAGDVVLTIVMTDRHTSPRLRVTSRPTTNVESALNGRRRS